MAEEIALNVEEPVDPVAPAAPAETKKEEPHENPTTISEYLESLLVTVLLALFGTSFVVQAFKIPSASMEGTLLIGDHLLVNKFIFGGSGAWYEKVLPYRPLERGDIIVFKYPYADHQHFVKRVIGLPGDRLKMVDQQMFVNGKPLNEPYVVHDHDQLANYDPFNTSFPPRRDQMISPQVITESGWKEILRNYVQGDEIVVPPGKLFAMGDNRDHSSDSRYWGFVDRSAIMGRPFLIYWSVDATSNDYTQTTFIQRLVGVFDTLAHLPSRTRWSRMLHTVH
jgi:signal peptidase I